jgi:hypothetical protein
LEDLRDLCRALNEKGAKYIVIGGFAVRAAGFDRTTMHIDLLIDTSIENERRVLQALELLPDKAARELKPGEVAQYAVVRVADEIVVDLMKAAAGMEYDEASRRSTVQVIDGVPVPFASPQLLWLTKKSTHRDKDAADLHFLRLWFEQRGETPPD